MIFVFFFKQKTAYEMRISDWSSDVCSSDLRADARGLHRDPAGPVPREPGGDRHRPHAGRHLRRRAGAGQARRDLRAQGGRRQDGPGAQEARRADARRRAGGRALMAVMPMLPELGLVALVLALLVTLLQAVLPLAGAQRGKSSEEHKSELQSLMRISYAVFCLKK